MSTVVSAKNKRTGRPRVDSEAVNVRMERPLLSALDAWRREQPDLPTRPEAVRRLVEKALGGDRKSDPKDAPEPPLILPEDEVDPEEF